MALGKAEP